MQHVSKEQAHRILNESKVNPRIPLREIQKALVITGDLVGLFGDQRTDCQPIGNDVSSKPWVSGVCSGQGKNDEEGPYGAVGRYARTRSI